MAAIDDDVGPARTITLEVFDGGLFSVREGDRYAEGLSWDDLLGQVASLTHHAFTKGMVRFPMLTEAEHRERREFWQAVNSKPVLKIAGAGLGELLGLAHEISAKYGISCAFGEYPKSGIFVPFDRSSAGEGPIGKPVEIAVEHGIDTAELKHGVEIPIVYGGQRVTGGYWDPDSAGPGAAEDEPTEIGFGPHEQAG